MASAHQVPRPHPGELQRDSPPEAAARRGRSAWALGLLALLAVSCRPTPDPFRLPKGTPVVLICVDTLRADRLGLYGYDLDTSPVLDHLGTQAYVFEETTTQCNATLPSITSILTGLFVRTHRNYIAVPVEGALRADETVRALPERLKDAGYATIATISHPSWREAPDSPGFSSGWSSLTVIPDGIPIELRPLAATGQYTNARTFAMLDHWRAANERARAAKEPERPLFLFSHYFDPHSDLDHNLYSPPPAYWNLYLRHHLKAVGMEHLYDVLAPLSPGQRHAWLVTHPVIDERRDIALAFGRALYDGEVRYVDYEIDRLFDRLRALGLFDDALIVVMADHGENMEDDNTLYGSIAFSHKRLREGVSHTPLIVRLPHQVAGARIPGLVQNIDVYPTVLELLGLPADPAAEGKSLVALMRDPGATLHDMVYVESSDHVERSIKTEDLKYVAPGPDVPPMLFRWRQDPEELNDVSAEVPESTTEAFARLLDEFKPHEALRLRFHPAERPVHVELSMRLAESEVLRAVPGDAVSALAVSELEVGEDRRSLRAVARVGVEPVELVISTKRRNVRSDWSFRVLDAATGEPVDADALAQRIFLGSLPLARSHAQPLLQQGDERAAADPGDLAWSIDHASEARTFAVRLAGADGADHRYELEGRYDRPSYEKGLELLEADGFARVVSDDAVVQRFEARGPRASALLQHAKDDAAVRFLARIDGAWPPLARTAVDGVRVRTDRLGFTLPFPLDARITTLLLGRGPRELPPGAITLHIDTRIDGAFTIDTSGMSEAQIQQLRVLGYVK